MNTLGSLLVLAAMLSFVPIVEAASPPITYPETPKPGDIDGNNTVDIFDYNLLITDFGKTGTFAADLDHDGTVGVFDYNLLLTNFGK